MAIVVERISRSGHVISSQVLEKNQIVIGRGFNCDVIVQDLHVDAQHLRVFFDSVTQSFACEDLGSKNGTNLYSGKGGIAPHKKKKLLGRRPFFSGQGFSLGKSYIRIYSTDHTVPESLPMSRWEGTEHVLSQWWFYLSIALGWLFLSTLDQYLTFPKTDKIFSYVLDSLTYPVGALVFAGFWGFVGKSLKHDSKFQLHFSVALLTMFAIALFDFVLPFLVYNLKIWYAASYLANLFVVVVLFIALYTTLTIACQLKPVFRVAMASIVPLVFLIPTIVGLINRPDFISIPNYEKALVSPAWQMRATISEDAFLENAQKLYNELDTGLAESND